MSSLTLGLFRSNQGEIGQKPKGEKQISKASLLDFYNYLIKSLISILSQCTISLHMYCVATSTNKMKTHYLFFEEVKTHDLSYSLIDVTTSHLMHM